MKIVNGSLRVKDFKDYVCGFWARIKLKVILLQVV